MQASPLHWLIADKTGVSIVVETDKDGMHVYDNPVGCLTNNPQFSCQLFNLNNYADVSPAMPKNNFSKEVNMNGYSRGLGSRNLPGGMDSESRFVRVAFNKFNAPVGKSEEENVDNYFHILHSVEQQRDLIKLALIHLNTLFTLMVPTLTKGFSITLLILISKLMSLT